jgi:hypothetical protein
LPEGIEEDIYVSNDSTVGIDYYWEGEYVMTYSQHLLEANDQYYDSESAIVTTVAVNTYSGTLVEYTNFEEKSIFWSDGEYVYTVASEFYDAEQLLLFAESVK